MYASFANQYATRIQKLKLFVDIIAKKEVGSITYDYTQKYVDDILIVSEDEILDSIKILMIKEKIIAKGTEAAPLAAVLSNYVPNIENKNVVCVVSGGNIDTLSKIILNGLN